MEVLGWHKWVGILGPGMTQDVRVSGASSREVWLSWCGTHWGCQSQTDVQCYPMVAHMVVRHKEEVVILG